MPTGKQIRAARVLAEWDAGELAQRVGMSRVSIQNLERGDSRPKTETVNKIIRAFFDAGIEFIEHEGLRRRSDSVEIFEGAERFDIFTELMLEHLQKDGGDVCLQTTDSSAFAAYRRDPEHYRRRMGEMVHAKRITFRILTTETRWAPGTFADYFQIRRQALQSPAPTAFYLYGTYLALISISGTNPPLVVLIKSESLAAAYRSSFEVAWRNADAAAH